MKRSFDSSFVSVSGSDSATTRTHSLHRRRATLAAHLFNIPENPQSIPYYLGQPLLTPTRYTLNDFERESDFQSNVWFHPASASTQYWSRLGTRPLTGLGITFDASEPSGSSAFALPLPPPPLPGLPMLSGPPILRGQREHAIALQRRPSQQLDQDDTMMSPERHDDTSQSAYSTCPGEEFVTRTPAHPDPDTLMYPADDLGMLVDSPAQTSDSRDALMEEDAPRSPVLPMVSPEGPVIGIFPDVNYRNLAAQKSSPVACVNPEDVTGDGPGPVIPKTEDEDMSMFVDSDLIASVSMRGESPDMQADFPEEALSAIVSVLAESVKQEQDAAVPGSSNGGVPPAFVSHPGSIPPPRFASRSGDTRIPLLRPIAVHVPRPPLAQVQPRDLTDNSPSTVHRPSPVLNAHEGVELDKLRSHAETFRQMNPGCELDKTFLQAFAGRLSERGELTAEFRCYVKGCCQTNKRRDHILVHVGSHVEHRPFQCDECGMRFLRKNECKRHMSSHVGVKPYTCPICAPYQEKSFVRQDLLKRHMKVTHGVLPQLLPDRRKRARVEDESPIPGPSNYEDAVEYMVMDQ